MTFPLDDYITSYFHTKLYIIFGGKCPKWLNFPTSSRYMHVHGSAVGILRQSSKVTLVEGLRSYT